MNISPARTAAFDILQKIEREQAYSSVLLPVYEEQLSVKDRALCHEITLGVLRRKLYLDRLIDEFVDKKLDLAVRVALHIGLYQLLFLDRIPGYSAINESVNLVQRAKKTSAKGLVNAVLRKVSRDVPVLKFKGEIERISVETSHPRWLIEKWINDLGIEEAESLAVANNDAGKLEFRATSKLDTVLTGHEDLETLNRLAAEGKIYFQDEGSQLVASVIKLTGGQRFLDVCAAPGSKTTYIADRYKTNENMLFAAGDLHRHRLEILKAGCTNQGLDLVNIIQYDAEVALPFADGAFDAVLVDAPCSGTGTIRHNPEIRYLLEEKDLGELHDKQLRILKNASKLVKSGGKLVYSTCSLEKEENEAVSVEFLEEHPDFGPVRPDVPEEFINPEGFARTFPHRDGMDGFFIAVFERTEGRI
jgi:16S rRNA (cytosine967-C5)-methyltransferase